MAIAPLMTAAPRRRAIVLVIVLAAHVLLMYGLWISHGIISRPADTDGYPMLALFNSTPPQQPVDTPPAEAQAQLIQTPIDWVPRVPDLTVSDPRKQTLKANAPSQSNAPREVDKQATNLSPAQPNESINITVVQRVVPVYPRTSARNGEEGIVSLLVHMDANGQVLEVKVERSSGFLQLDESALHAVRQWVFAPPASSPSGDVWSKVGVRFNLYSFSFSKVGDLRPDIATVEHTRLGEADSAPPGGEATLSKFINEDLAGDPDRERTADSRLQMIQMKNALTEWGPALQVHFAGRVGDGAWDVYQVKPEYRGSNELATAEVRWDMYEVKHAKATSLWRVAMDRKGVLWSVQAGLAP